MNALQKSKIKKLVQEDCQIKGSYCIEGKTCVIGKMAIEAGIPPERFDKNNSDCIDMLVLRDVAVILKEVYGLNPDHLRKIQIKNDGEAFILYDDGYEDKEDEILLRRERILEYLETIPVDP